MWSATALDVERDGAGRDGDPAQVFDRELDRADGAAFVERCEDDRHHFRVIIAPERGAAIDDLKDYTRDLMRTVESDLDTRIDWIAAEHHDTGRAHVHLLMRGVRADGRDLVIPRAYVSHGFRERAEGLATELLGPRLEPDRADRVVKQERLTELDRELVARSRGQEIAMSALPEDRVRAARLVQRLNRLEEMGLAEPARAGVWRLDAELEEKLIRLFICRTDAVDAARCLRRGRNRHDSTVLCVHIGDGCHRSGAAALALAGHSARAGSADLCRHCGRALRRRSIR